jgi:DNA-binding MarR family transcriptional regulator
VRDMMAKEELGAPATIHGRLKSMREKGWITLADTEDARRKQVALTQLFWREREGLLHGEGFPVCNRANVC